MSICFTNDESILKSIAGLVYTIIIDKLSNSEATIQRVAVNIVQITELVNSVVSQLDDQKDGVKQEIFESILFDSSEEKSKVKQLEEFCNDLQKKY